jgi:CheY-like chemotaxis protein
MKTPRTVLIIDDDLDYASAIRDLLETAGYRVLHAAEGRRGLELAKIERPDLVLLDVMMTERTEGFFVLQEIRRDAGIGQTPVIVSSSIYSDEPGFRVSPEAGWLPASLFLAKPVDPRRLLEEVRRLLGELSEAAAEAEDLGGEP